MHQEVQIPNPGCHVYIMETANTRRAYCSQRRMNQLSLSAVEQAPKGTAADILQAPKKGTERMRTCAQTQNATQSAT